MTSTLPSADRDASRSPSSPVPRWLTTALIVFALALAIWQATTLVLRWQAWRSGAPEFYPGYHRGLVLNAATGLLIAVALPIPLVLARAPHASRARRGVLLGVWAVLMAGVWVLLGLGCYRA